jgi:prepilin-type N-terminal cleavage/methylation domain-containing protein
MVNGQNKMKKLGFTLIELLVVIAIIALLASIILSSLGQSRQKGRDAQVSLQFREYINALALYKSDHGYFPYQCAADDTTCSTYGSEKEACLGEGYPSTMTYCGGSDGTTATDKLKNSLSPYLSSFPPLMISGFDAPVYYCDPTTLKPSKSGCEKTIVSFWITSNLKCPKIQNGTVVQTNGSTNNGPITSCVITLN